MSCLAQYRGGWNRVSIRDMRLCAVAIERHSGGPLVAGDGHQPSFIGKTQTDASRSTVSGKRWTRRIKSAACAFGLARPCSQFSSVLGLVRK